MGGGFSEEKVVDRASELIEGNRRKKRGKRERERDENDEDEGMSIE